MTPAITPSPLIFSWAPPRRRARALIVFLIASIILHAACFYIFQIVYPPTVALLPAPARVSLISPDDSESIAFLRWVEAEDPALATTTQRPPGSKTIDLPKLQHIPSYAAHEPKLKALPPTTPNLSIPSSAAIGPVRIPTPSSNTAIAPPIAHKTSVQFSESADALGTPTVPGFTFQASRMDAPANARFRVGIDGGGAMRFCFLIESSGDPALDEQGRSFLQLCRFEAKENVASDEPALVWSVATILWGNDITPASSSTPASSP
jgi:hypothetical protein